MEKHRLLTDQEFEFQFSNCSMSSVLFTHEAHLRLAWIQISQYGLEEAINNVCAQIQRYALSLGAVDKYNATVTVAAVKAVNHFMNKSVSKNFIDLIEEFPRLKSNFKGLMNAHYSVDIFNSKEAKVKFLEPDLLPFD